MKGDLPFLAERLTAMLDVPRLSVLIRRRGIGKPKDHAGPRENRLPRFCPRAREASKSRDFCNSILVFKLQLREQEGIAHGSRRFRPPICTVDPVPDSP